MKSRIGLFTPTTKRRKKGSPTTTVTYVEAGAAPDLTEKLVALGATKVSLLVRDRTGETRPEGKPFAPSAMNAEHFAWLTEASKEFQTRGLFYE
jgi:hypothetical protein